MSKNPYTMSVKALQKELDDRKIGYKSDDSKNVLAGLLAPIVKKENAEAEKVAIEKHEEEKKAAAEAAAANGDAPVEEPKKRITESGGVQKTIERNVIHNGETYLKGTVVHSDHPHFEALEQGKFFL